MKRDGDSWEFWPEIFDQGVISLEKLEARWSALEHPGNVRECRLRLQEKSGAEDIEDFLTMLPRRLYNFLLSYEAPTDISQQLAALGKVGRIAPRVDSLRLDMIAASLEDLPLTTTLTSETVPRMNQIRKLTLIVRHQDPHLDKSSLGNLPAVRTKILAPVLLALDGPDCEYMIVFWGPNYRSDDTSCILMGHITDIVERDRLSSVPGWRRPGGQINEQTFQAGVYLSVQV